MEVQLTDEENAAFVIFIVLITRLILSFNLDMLIPISKVCQHFKELREGYLHLFCAPLPIFRLLGYSENNFKIGAKLLCLK